MTTDKDPSRAAFEAQCEYLGESTRRIFTSPDQYSSSATALAWAMWQASREQALMDVTQELSGMTCNNATARSAIKLCIEAIGEMK